ncbi:MAG: hypothetical protein K6G90_09705, partial [Clostridia bacterium]|nr:hypothetical protein [Clostridia bacterium]
EPVKGALGLIANLIYFINADGLTTVVANLLQPAEGLFAAATPFLGDDMSDKTLVKVISDLINVEYVDLTDLSMAAVINIVENIEINGVKLDIPATAEALLENFYIGAVESYASANDLASYKLAYVAYDGNESTFGTEADMITIILCLAIDIIRYNGNAAVLGDYAPIVENVLKLKELEVDPAQGMSWYDTDKIGTTINAVKEAQMEDIYGEYWTREMAQYVADHFDEFLANIFCLLGLEINGISIDSLSDLLEGVISGNLYTQANADKIINAIRGLVAKLDDILVDGTSATAKQLVRDMLAIDLDAWNDMTVTVIDGDADSFKDALMTILAPATPVLALLLADVDFSILYKTDDGATAEDAITLPGSQGYAYAILPLLQALKCENMASFETFKSTIIAEYEAGKATCTYQGNAIRLVLDPLTDRIDAIESNAATEILDMLPGLIYFINSNGVDTVFTNLVTSVDTVLAAIYPAFKYDDGTTVRAMTTEDLIPLDKLSFTATDGTVYGNVRLENIDIIWLVDFALVLLRDKLGVTLKKSSFSPLTELTNGTLTDIRAQMEALGVTAGDITGRDGQPNGTFDPYLTIKKTSEEDPETRGALVTALGAVIIGFISEKDNNEQIYALLDRYISDESTRGYVKDFVALLISAFQNDTTHGYALYVVYYTFVGLDHALEAVDDAYHDVNNTWAFLMYMMKDSGDVALNHIEYQLAEWLRRNMPDIADEEHIVAPNGFIRFFQSLANFFKKLIETFKRLFGG